jgi:hypothetical protein
LEEERLKPQKSFIEQIEEVDPEPTIEDLGENKEDAA